MSEAPHHPPLPGTIVSSGSLPGPRWRPGPSVRLLLLAACCAALAGCLDILGGGDEFGSNICMLGPDVELELPCTDRPARVADDPGFVALAAGQYHTCGLTADGRVSCWGADLVGELGAGGWPGVVPNPTPLEGVERYVAIGAGRTHSCAVSTEDVAHCWGANYAGQLGTGVSGDGDPSSSAVPAAVEGEVAFAQVRGGADHTCGLDALGAAHCWGMDWYGEVGQAVWTMSSRPAPLPVVTDLAFAAIDAGLRVTCALTSEGEAWCWGLGHSGELGTAQASVCDNFGIPITCSPVPVRVETGERFTGLATGTSHTCAVTAEGDVHCWGDPGQGQLGPNGHYGYTPVHVPDVQLDRIHAGGATSCGLTAAGEAFCWGGNWAGQLGTGSDEFAENTPAPVLGGHRFEVLAIGYAHSCGITTGGETYCWGSNERGQLGAGRW